MFCFLKPFLDHFLLPDGFLSIQIQLVVWHVNNLGCWLLSISPLGFLPYPRHAIHVLEYGSEKSFITSHISTCFLVTFVFCCFLCLLIYSTFFNLFHCLRCFHFSFLFIYFLFFFCVFFFFLLFLICVHVLSVFVIFLLKKHCQSRPLAFRYTV